MRKLSVGIAILLVLGTPAGAAPNTEPISFSIRGRSEHWEVTDLFTPAQFQDGVGYEFGPHLTYRGPEHRIRWFRIEPLFPQAISIRVRPNPPMKRGACVIDIDSTDPAGTPTPTGERYTFGRCDIYPWKQGGEALAKLVQQGLYQVAWEDETGVHTEGVRTAEIQFGQGGYPD